MTPLAIMLMGPTASGKTDLALRLAERFPLEIISVDSSLVYKGMDIGTAKPDAELLTKFPHRLIDIREPNQPYSASDFREDAIREMTAITNEGRVPLLVGGTMLYFKVLLDGIADLPPADEQIRARIVEKARNVGWNAIHQELEKIDPVAADRIHPNDAQRIQRAIEVFEITGKTLTDLQNGGSGHIKSTADEAEEVARNDWNGSKALPFRFISLALMTENRALLHERIESRFNLMLSNGLVDEVSALKQKFPTERELPAMKAVGYRQVWQYLVGELNYEEMLASGVAATRQLAKRQITWLRSWANVHYFDIEDPELFGHVTKKVSDLLEIKE